MFAPSPADFVADDCQTLFHDTVLPELKAKGVWQGELVLKHQRSGDPIDVYSTFFMVKDPASGKPMCIANVARDTRERRRAARTERRAEMAAFADRRAQQIADHGADGERHHSIAADFHRG